MATYPDVSAGVSGWRELYFAALFEGNRSCLKTRIEQAERALVKRERELFLSTQESRTEQNALAAARNALSALKSCHGLE